MSETELLQISTHLGVTVIKPVSNSFTQALNYRRYRLNNMPDRLPHTLTGRLSGYSKRLKAHRHTYFSLIVRDFVRPHPNQPMPRDADTRIRSLRPTKTDTYHYLRQPNITYPKMINFLRTKYASNETILKAVDKTNNLFPTPQPTRLRFRRLRATSHQPFWIRLLTTH